MANSGGNSPDQSRGRTRGVLTTFSCCPRCLPQVVTPSRIFQPEPLFFPDPLYPPFHDKALFCLVGNSKSRKTKIASKTKIVSARNGSQHAKDKAEKRAD